MDEPEPAFCKSVFDAVRTVVVKTHTPEGGSGSLYANLSFQLQLGDGHDDVPSAVAAGADGKAPDGSPGCDREV